MSLSGIVAWMGNKRNACSLLWYKCAKGPLETSRKKCEISFKI